MSTANTPHTPKKIPLAYFLIPLLVQLGIILLIPSRSFYTYKTGQDVVIQTAPVDPYDLLRGYSQTLSYEISRFPNLKKLPGGQDLEKNNSFYLVLKAPSKTSKTPPEPWQPVSISQVKPQDLESNQIAIKGLITNFNRVEYGLERYYMPEDQRDRLNKEIRNLNNSRNQNFENNDNSNNRRPFLVSIKVDRNGNSVPVSLWLGDRNYKF